MSLSLPAKFPLLKLPWLCIKCVLLNSDLFDIISFATISDRTRRIVRSSSYPIKEMNVILSGSKIGFKDGLGRGKSWFFIHDKNADNGTFLLPGVSLPFRISRHFDARRGHHLQSRTIGDKLDALKMGIEFMIDVFGCTIRRVSVVGNELSELVRLGISSAKMLFINNPGPVNITDLKYLLENIKVTDRYVFRAPIPSNFSCDPRIFKCRKVSFNNQSADWVTLELLCQFDVSQLFFPYHQFSVEDIVSYITHWFNSENRKLEYVQFKFNNPVSHEHFKIDHLNPMPFDEQRRNRCPSVGGWEDTDVSCGMDILRKDGLLATIFVEDTYILFYVWHNRFPDDVQHN